MRTEATGKLTHFEKFQRLIVFIMLKSKKGTDETESWYIGYLQAENSYCDGIVREYTSFAEATDNCDLDQACGGFYDKCGEGNLFRACRAPIARLSSSCGAVLHTKQIHLKRTSINMIISLMALNLIFT